MARLRQLALVLLCGTVALAVWCAPWPGGLGWSGVENTATPIRNREATRAATTSSADLGAAGAPLAPAMASVALATSDLTLPTPPVADAAASPGLTEVSSRAIMTASTITEP